MSRIEIVRIRNFRSIKQADVNLNDLNVFVGKNNVGKTNLLKALLWFVNPNIGVDAVDFCDGSLELEVSCKIVDISKEQQEKINNYYGSLHRYIRNNCLYIQRRAYIERSEERRVHVDSRCVSGDGSLETGVWIRSSDVSEEDIQEVLPKLLYIPALFSLDKTVEKFALKALENLADIVLSSHGVVYNVNFLTKDRIERFNNQNIVRHVEDEINKELRYFSVGNDIKIKILPPAVKEDGLLSTSVCFEEDGVCRKTEYFGQGLIRMAQVAMLRYLARDQGKYGDSVLLLMDEPELSLHPQVIDEISRTFIMLTENNQLTFQVLLCTHSPVIVKNRIMFENTRVVTKEDGCCIKERNLIENNEAILRIALDLENLAYSLFSDLVIIVEGVSDKILLSETLREYDSNGIYRKISILSSQSCKNSFGLRKLLQSMGLKVILVQDFDALQNKEYRKFGEYSSFDESLRFFISEKYPERTSLGAKEMEVFVADKARLATAVPLIDKLKQNAIWTWPCGDIENVFYGEVKGNNKPALASEYIEKRIGMLWSCYIDANGGDSGIVSNFVNWVNSYLWEI